MQTIPTALAQMHCADSGVHQAVEGLRAKLGDRLVIMGHHYMADDVIAHVDRVGDSLELSRMVEEIAAEHIVFCGVHFMAETARLLARDRQQVHIPDAGADCVMANMVPADLLETVLRRLGDSGRRVTPLAYVNTSLAVKAVVGRYGGAVCTSANARAMMEWALEQGDAVLFLPDKKLAANTANQIGLPERERGVVDIRDNGARLDGLAAAGKTLLMWPGCCAVHAPLRGATVATVRHQYPGVRVLVHPECAPETVDAADGAGSTSYLIREAENAPDGSVLAIGTESNLVQRLAARHQGRVTIVPVLSVACSNMAKIHAVNLLTTLRQIEQGTAVPLTVDPGLIEPARASIARMLEHTAARA